MLIESLQEVEKLKETKDWTGCLWYNLTAILMLDFLQVLTPRNVSENRVRNASRDEDRSQNLRKHFGLVLEVTMKQQLKHCL